MNDRRPQAGRCGGRLAMLAAGGLALASGLPGHADTGTRAQERTSAGAVYCLKAANSLSSAARHSDADFRASVEAIAETVDLFASAQDAEAYDRLDAIAPAGTAAIDPFAAAAYCTLLGETMRRTRPAEQAIARRTLRSAIQIGEEANRPRMTARASYSLAQTVLAQPDTVTGSRSAIDVMEVVRRSTQIGDTVCEQAAAGASTRAGLDTGVAALDCAAARAAEAGDERIAALSRLRLARYFLALDRLRSDEGFSRDQARAVAEEALVISPTLHIREPGLALRVVEVSLEAGTDNLSLIADRLSEIGDANPEDIGVQAWRSGLTADLLARQGNLEGAEFHVSRAITLEAQKPLPERLPDWLLLQDRLFTGAGDGTNSDTALRLLARMRPLLPAFDAVTEERYFSVRTRQTFASVLKDRIARLQTGDPSGRENAIEAVQALVEAYREAELQDTFGNACVPPVNTLDIAALQPGELILYPITVGDDVHLLVASSRQPGTWTYVPPVTARDAGGGDTLATSMDRMLGGILNPGSSTDWIAAAQHLYRRIILPIEDEIAALGPDPTLVILPDARLRRLPFAALIDGEDRFLVQRVRLASAPSLSYAQPGLSTGPNDRTGPRILAASLSKAVALPVGRFSKLDHTLGEAQAAMRAMGQEEPARGRLIEDFTRSDLESALTDAPVDVLHLATHANFNGRSENSYVVAADGALPITDLQALIAGLRTRGDALDLLVLSACETAVGDDGASMGLAGAAVQSGATSAIASLWAVNDRSTATLMGEFYDHYGDVPTAEALRRAQVTLIENTPYNHPYYWAAFTLLGGWR